MIFLIMKVIQIFAYLYYPLSSRYFWGTVFEKTLVPSLVLHYACPLDPSSHFTQAARTPSKPVSTCGLVGLVTSLPEVLGAGNWTAGNIKGRSHSKANPNHM